MANNISVKDAAAASITLKTTDNATVHTPHHNVDSIAAGNNNIGDVDVASIAAGDNNIGDVDVASIAAGDNNIGNVDVVTLPALATGTNIIGATKDAGPNWTSVMTYTTSADMQTAAALTAAPTAGQKIVITDILISSDTIMLFEFEEETSATVFAAVRLAVNSPVQITPRGKWKLNTADKKLFGDAGAAGNVYITVWYYSEA